jgi:hypothetical protein
VVWAGGGGHVGNALRSIPLATFARVFATPGWRWHVLQKDVPADDAPSFTSSPEPSTL